MFNLSSRNLRILLAAIVAALLVALAIFVARTVISARKAIRVVVMETSITRQKQQEQAEALKKIEERLVAVGQTGKDSSPRTSEVDASIAEQLAAMTEQLESLTADRAEGAGAVGTAAVSGPSWSIIDGVDIYQKDGRLEFYGLTVDQRRHGAVSSSAMVIDTRSPKSWLVWHPAHRPVVAPRTLTLDFAPGTKTAGKMAVALRLSNDKVVRFPLVLGPPVPGGVAGPAAKAPPDVEQAFAGNAQVATLRQVSATRFVARLPRSLASLMDTAGQDGVGITYVGLEFEHPTPTTLAIRSLRLDGGAPVEPGQMVRLSGVVSGHSGLSGRIVELIDDAGGRQSATLALDGSFGFANVPAQSPVSLRFEHEGRIYHAATGRWFMASDPHSRTDIRIAPEFFNPSAAPPNKADIALSGEVSTEDGKLPARYMPNTRTSWPGAGPVQEFAGRSFANGAGLLDRDRQLFNRDRCLRVFAVGGSTYVSLQVAVHEKFTSVLEAELGRRLGHCVELISAGRDNGDLGAIYPFIANYGSKFDPDVILIEQMTALTMQMGPELVRRTLGYKYENNVLDHFYFDEKGVLTFRKWDPSWALDAVKPSGEPLIPGLNIWHSMNIPYVDFHKEAQDAFRLAEAILQRIKAENPRARVVLATGRDQAGCLKAGICEGEFKLPDGRTVPMGVNTALENFSGMCERAGVTCIHPPIPRKGTPFESGIIYQHDGHYTVKGHQWLARHLADGLEPLLREIKDKAQ
jgi:hypothetical protein